MVRKAQPTLEAISRQSEAKNSTFFRQKSGNLNTFSSWKLKGKFLQLSQPQTKMSHFVSNLFFFLAKFVYLVLPNRGNPYSTFSYSWIAGLSKYLRWKGRWSLCVKRANKKRCLKRNLCFRHGKRPHARSIRGSLRRNKLHFIVGTQVARGIYVYAPFVRSSSTLPRVRCEICQFLLFCTRYVFLYAPLFFMEIMLKNLTNYFDKNALFHT